MPVRIKTAGALYGNSSSSHIVPKNADEEDDFSSEEGNKEGTKGGL